ncbi:MAG: hypothetical protein ACREF1_01145, partial [Acetobacteraceae bacterium]
DISAPLAWDAAILSVDALRELGADAKPEQLRAYLAGITDWAGINGIYNFVKIPQRGLDISDAVVARWDPAKDTWVNASKPGGAPLQ